MFSLMWKDSTAMPFSTSNLLFNVEVEFGVKIIKTFEIKPKNEEKLP